MLKQIIRFEIIVDCVGQCQESQLLREVYEHSLQTPGGIGPAGSLPFFLPCVNHGTADDTEIRGNIEFLLFPYNMWHESQSHPNGQG